MKLVDKLISTSALNLLDYALKISVVLVTSPLLINHLGKEEYGLWVLILSIIGYLDLLDLGLSQTAVRYISMTIGSKDDKKTIKIFSHFYNLYKKITITSLLITALACIAMIFLSNENSIPHRTIYLLSAGGAASSLTFLSRIYISLLKSHILYNKIIIAGMVRVAVYTCLLITVLINKGGIEMLAAAWMAGIFIEQLTIWRMASDVTPKQNLDSPLDKCESVEIRRYATKNLIGQGARFMRERLDTLVLGVFIGTSAVTYYSVGTRLVIIFSDVINAIFGGHLLPAFTQIVGSGGALQAEKKLFQSLSISVPIVLAGGCALFLLGPQFVNCWLGSGYEEANKIIKILSIPTAFILMQSPTSAYLASLNKHGMLAWTTLIGGAVNLALSLAFIRWMGTTGVVIATALELTIAALVVRPWLVVRESSINLKEYLNLMWKSARIFLPFTIFVEVLFHQTANTTSWLKFFTFSVAVTIPLLICTWWGALTSDNRNSIISQMRNWKKPTTK